MTRKIATTMIALGLLLTPLAQAADESSHIKQIPLTKDTLGNLGGEILYRDMCQPCHGVSGRGDATAINLLIPPPADLTRLAAKNGGKFPAFRVIQTISGEHHETVHGSEMPKWEQILTSRMGKSRARLRVYNLTQYVKSLQEAGAGS